MKEGIKNKIRNRIGIKFKKVILYRNPNEFTTLSIERINPNHVGLIWGRRHKKFNKGTHYVKVGKIFFELIPVAFGVAVLIYVDALTNYIYMLALQAGVLGITFSAFLSMLIFFLPFKLEKKLCYLKYC